MLNDLWLLLSGFLIFVGLVASKGLLIVVGALIILIWSSTKLWERFALRKIILTRSISRKRVFIGDTIDYDISIYNGKLLPLIWCDVSETFPSGLTLLNGRVMGSVIETRREHHLRSSLLPYEKINWRFKLECNQRGYHRIGPAELRSGDIFGFSSVSSKFPDVEEILVYPEIIDLDDLIKPSEYPLEGSTGRIPISQDINKFSGLRNYLASDPLKFISWKHTAKTGSLQVKQYEPVVALNVLIAMNGKTNEYAWQGGNSASFERTVTLTASLAKCCLDRKYSVGLISNSIAAYSGKWINLAISSSNNQFDLIMQNLAMVGQHTITTLEQVLEAEHRFITQGTTVAVTTPLISNALANEIREIKHRGHPVIIFYSGNLEPRIKIEDVSMFYVNNQFKPNSSK